MGLKETIAVLPQSEHLISDILFCIVIITPSSSEVLLKKVNFPIIIVTKSAADLKVVIGVCTILSVLKSYFVL
jgi:hypothetical protein